MAGKKKTNRIRLVSSEGSGYFYITTRNPKSDGEKLRLRKYDPKLRKHVEFREKKMK